MSNCCFDHLFEDFKDISRVHLIHPKISNRVFQQDLSVAVRLRLKRRPLSSYVAAAAAVLKWFMPWEGCIARVAALSDDTADAVVATSSDSAAPSSSAKHAWSTTVARIAAALDAADPVDEGSPSGGLESDPLAVGPVLHENEQQLVAMSAPPSAAVCCSLSAKQVLSRALHILKQSGAQGALLYQNLDGGPEVGIGNEESEAQSREKVEADSWTR